MLRAINTPLLRPANYVSIILWEAISLIHRWVGWHPHGALIAVFQKAEGISIAALALSLTMELIAFLAVGGEWFLMLQSKSWSGQGAAFCMFTVIGIVLLLVALPDTSDQPWLFLWSAVE
jgi:predicted small integral membrane protein